ncbi:MAG: DUF4296 domain-containing protein [Bacteroidetes bacterium]|jgi:hypothetical protein|nr:DUF4296 domain-containing protein [Bacteroidota bacterium]
MKKIIFFLAIVITGCQNVQRPPKPENLIGEDKMVEILTDLYLANAARGIGSREMIHKNIRLDSLIYAKYDIDSTQFAQSNNYYAGSIDTYIDIFQKVEANLVAMEKEVDSLFNQRLKLKQPDSVKTTNEIP